MKNCGLNAGSIDIDFDKVSYRDVINFRFAKENQLKNFQQKELAEQIVKYRSVILTSIDPELKIDFDDAISFLRDVLLECHVTLEQSFESLASELNVLFHSPLSKKVTVLELAYFLGHNSKKILTFSAPVDITDELGDDITYEKLEDCALSEQVFATGYPELHRLDEILDQNVNNNSIEKQEVTDKSELKQDGETVQNFLESLDKEKSSENNKLEEGKDLNTSDVQNKEPTEEEKEFKSDDELHEDDPIKMPDLHEEKVESKESRSSETTEEQEKTQDSELEAYLKEIRDVTKDMHDFEIKLPTSIQDKPILKYSSIDKLYSLPGTLDPDFTKYTVSNITFYLAKA